MKRNDIKITRIAGEGGAICTATLKLEFDPNDSAAVERFARVLKELIPEDEREHFVEDFKAAGREASLEAFAG